MGLGVLVNHIAEMHHISLLYRLDGSCYTYNTHTHIHTLTSIQRRFSYAICNTFPPFSIIYQVFSFAI